MGNDVLHLAQKVDNVLVVPWVDPGELTSGCAQDGLRRLMTTITETEQHVQFVFPRLDIATVPTVMDLEATGLSAGRISPAPLAAPVRSVHYFEALLLPAGVL